MLTKILKACSLGVIAFWLVTLVWLASDCHGQWYGGPIWEWQVVGVDNWETFTTLESCISQEVYQVGGEGAPRVFWNLPLMGILLWWLGSLIAMRPYRRYSDDDVAAVREKARRKL